MNRLVIQRTLSMTVAILAGLNAAAIFADTDSSAPLGPQIVSCRIGFDGNYKVGHWTAVRVAVDLAKAIDADFTVEVEVNDSDGVATVVSEPVAPSPSATLLYTKFGRLGAAIHVRLMSDGKQVDESVLEPTIRSESGQTLSDIPATGELLLAFGSTPFGFAEAYSDRAAEAGVPARRLVSLTSIEDLPNNWFGYEGVDVFILSAGDGVLCRELAADEARFAALRKWVEMGGKLVVLCGGQAGKALLAEDGPLASLAPGRFVDIGRLTDTGALEHYAQSDVAIVAPGARSELLVSQLADVHGNVELYGSGAGQLPLVIRTPRGLGEVTFAGVDLDAAPIANWSGRTAFLRTLLQPLVVNAEASDAPRKLVTSGYDDLSGALRQRLGQAFSGVRPISFRSVVGLTILYLLILGPLDYVIVHKWFRRPWIAWISFPLILLLFGAGALVLARSRDATGPAVNQVELVDVDIATGQARGAYWATLYSPNARRYDLKLDVRFPANDRTAAAESLLSWHGLAGSGIGGMGGGGDFNVIPVAYRLTANSELRGMPALTAATKSLSARWTTPATNLIAAQLVDDDGMIAGSITNQTGVTLHNARLMYGGWAYRLKEIEPGASPEVNEQLTPISVQTLVTGLALGSPSGAARSSEQTRLPTDRASSTELLNAMMFYESAGGSDFAGLPFRYQSYCDLSRLLELGRAVLVAEVPAAGSRLIDSETGRPISNGDRDSSLTVYRFVLPVAKTRE